MKLLLPNQKPRNPFARPARLRSAGLHRTPGKAARLAARRALARALADGADGDP